MTETNRCDCLKQAGRPCDACWQVAFDKLREEARAEDLANGDIGRIIEPPSPAGREAKVSLDALAKFLYHTSTEGASAVPAKHLRGRRRRGGSHRGEARLTDDDDHRARHQGRFIPAGNTSRMLSDTHGGRALFARELPPDHPSLCEWVCPKCGPLSRRYPPMLADEDDEYHCSSLDCEEIVFRVQDLLASKAKAESAASESEPIAASDDADERAAEDQPEAEPTPEEMGIRSSLIGSGVDLMLFVERDENGQFLTPPKEEPPITTEDAQPAEPAA